MYSITSILDNKIEKGIEGNLERVLQTLETTLSNLYDVSQQMSFEGFVGQDMLIDPKMVEFTTYTGLPT
ncbi:hypothetical protein GCM10010912_67630 [Paenibacillus albidus]|uniref:Uncharacterized protein n=1 Tax=Paenibacillus albidus TaxID=2041023 RepID=A0A917D948_9BACL|nr:hypothetical protein [Paenibacillus albidus]GGG13695.1 hypothetical protein GCM10010912_67630 [Paenibacillus albidus]